MFCKFFIVFDYIIRVSVNWVSANWEITSNKCAPGEFYTALRMANVAAIRLIVTNRYVMCYVLCAFGTPASKTS